ncbi:hypothetical protein BpHYR1_050658 [Brachionus plicatilis]|uniref:Uncharacterized protein n=1 Tax=Brachionus plicatilis TaxID=10195 RepID=A0A3M7QLX4_BRAPC|nr:hypothetical protein BpHYR1_050658 [Brachionus plicatilis]
MADRKFEQQLTDCVANVLSKEVLNKDLVRKVDALWFLFLNDFKSLPFATVLLMLKKMLMLTYY